MSVTISFNSTKRGKGKYPLEVDEQKACWAWLATVPSDDPSGRPLQNYAYMVPNGTQLAGARTRRAMYMASLKAQGFRPGVSDIVIAYPTYFEGYHGMGGGSDSGGHFGAYIELKRDRRAYKGPAALKSALKPEQRDWLELMSSVGYWAAIAYGRNDFTTLVNSYLRGESPRPLDFIPPLEDTQGAQ